MRVAQQPIANCGVGNEYGRLQKVLVRPERQGEALDHEGTVEVWNETAEASYELHHATVAGGLVSDPEVSEVSDKVGFAYAPTAVTENGSHWLWAWSLGIETASKNKEAAFEFLRWSTSKEYLKLVGEKLGYARVPPGTRVSTYEDTPYGKNPWTDVELTSIETANPSEPTRDPVPYTGIQYIPIPEFQQLGDAVGRLVASVVTGDLSTQEFQERAQAEALKVAKEGKYLKS